MINAGAMLVAAANELVFLFVGLELVSIPTYLLLYLLAAERDDAGGGDQVFLPEHLLVGPAPVRPGVPLRPDRGEQPEGPGVPVHAGRDVRRPAAMLGLIAVVFVMAGLGFRVAAVPFHFYAPDVYQGSPTVIAALLAWVPKGVGFLAMLRTLTAVVSAGGGVGRARSPRRSCSPGSSRW